MCNKQNLVIATLLQKMAGFTEADGDIFITQSSFMSTGEVCELGLDMMDEQESRTSEIGASWDLGFDWMEDQENRASESTATYPYFDDISDDETCDSSTKQIESLQDDANDDEMLISAANEIESSLPPCVSGVHVPVDLSVTPPVTSVRPAGSRIRKVYTDDDMKKLEKKSLAANTEKKIRWAVNLFEKWKIERNRIAAYDGSISYIAPDLNEMTTDELNFAISRFICEINKENGEEYIGQTLYELVIQLQLYLEQRGKLYKLLNEERFLQIKNTLDHIMKERAASGVGIDKRKALTVTAEEEDKMWSLGILGSDTPHRLLDTLVYLIGLNFAFRAGLEHRSLRWENPQLTLLTSDGEEVLRYTQDVSKTNQGGLASRKIKRKTVVAFQNKQRPERCLIRIYKLYLQHCPEEKPAASFYLKPLRKPRGTVWFGSVPVGVHTLTGTVRRLCSEAGLEGLRTNHSLRATAATRLYEAGVDEQLIKEVTGHRGDAVREYKRTNERMQRSANSIINNSNEGIFQRTAESKQGPISVTVNVNVSN